MKPTSCAYYDTLLGPIRISYSGLGITSLCFVPNGHPIFESQPSELSDTLFVQVCEYANGERKRFDVPLDLAGTSFQLKVWEVLMGIPYGETRTYKEVAIALGNAKAARAVGMASHKNKLLLLIPCHRVIGADGKLVGYAGGLDLKKTLLQIEQVLPVQLNLGDELL